MAGRYDIQYVQFYTDGSAARKLEPVRPVPAAIPKLRKPKRKAVYVDPVATLGIVVAVCMLIAMAVGVIELGNARQDTVLMEQYVQQLKLENQELRAEYTAGYDLRVVERSALALGMVPVEQVPHISVEITEPQAQETEPSVWDRIGTFFTELFA